MQRAVLILTAIAIAATAYVVWWGNGEQDPQTVLASIGDQQITLADFRQEMAKRGGHIPGQYRTVEQRQELLDLMIEHRLLVAGALSAGYMEDADVQRLIEKILVNKYFEQELRQRLEAVVISEQDVEDYYQQNSENYTIASQRRAAIIRMAWPQNVSEEQRLVVVEKLLAVHDQVAVDLDADVSHFGQLARQNSDDRASRFQGGVIGWLQANPQRPYRWDPVVLEALFELSEVGDIAGPLLGDDAAYLVRLAGIKPQTMRPLKSVADGIRHAMNNNRRDQVRAEFLAEVRQDVPVETHPKRLEAVQPISGPAVAEGNRPPTTPTG